MAKKKGRRSANVARKREKRNRDRKSRQKQLAIEKQRRLPYEKSEEAHLHACISQSRKLLDEPELEGVRFDFELMYARVMEVLDGYNVDEVDEANPAASDSRTMDQTVSDKSEPSLLPEPERACDHFRHEVLPHLVTPDFMEQLGQALAACETRLKLTGNRELAEVAFVTRSLFEVSPPEILAFHPMIQTLGIETLRILVEEPDMIVERRDEVREVLTNVIEQEDSETYQSEAIPVFPELEQNPQQKEPPASETLPSLLMEPEEVLFTPAPPPPAQVEPEQAPARTFVTPPISPDELPARALYKNFNGLEIKTCFQDKTDDASLQAPSKPYALVNETEEKVELVDIENERYITLTEERLELHARSEAELALAMAEVEAQCTSAVMYLAKTIEERG